MQIKEIIIKGWRSFDNEEGITLKNLKKINIIIGPNNSGKSNLGKYFFWIKDILDKIQANLDVSSYDNYNLISETINKDDTWAWNKNEIESVILFDYPQNPEFFSRKPYYPEDKTKTIILKSKHRIYSNTHCFSLMSGGQFNKKVLEEFKNKPQIKSLNRYEDHNSASKGLLDSIIYWKTFKDSIVFIEPVRSHKVNGNTNNKNFYYDGSDITNKISSLDSESHIAFEDTINKWLQFLLNESINFRFEKNIVTFRINRADAIMSCTLDDVGTGVSQLFMILSFLYLNKDKYLTVFIDEPESNLHPESVKLLVDIFEKKFPNHTFFITTHSTILIDQMNDNWSIHRVFRKDNKPSKYLPCDTLVSKYEVLDHLGIRASQILQSNLIIWVEGPSDRIYLKKWIEDISKEQQLNLIEGKDFSFLIYGGSNLSSHTILSEDNSNIDILATSRYAVIFCDSDLKDEGGENDLKQRVQNISNRFKEVKAQELGSEKDISDFIKIWITGGRETENYIPKDLLFEVLTTPNLVRKEIGKEKNRKTLEVDKSIITTKDFDKYNSYDNFFTQIYKSNGNDLNVEEIKNIASHYASKKVEIAIEVTRCWKSEYYEGNLDLKEKVNEVVGLIKRAKGLM